MFGNKRKDDKAVFESEREYQLLLAALSKYGNFLEGYETGSMSELACEIFSRMVASTHPELNVDCVQNVPGENTSTDSFFYRISSKKMDNGSELIMELNK